jgi:hypothetical protein
MTAREAYKDQLAAYKKELEFWQNEPDSRPDTYVGPGDNSGIGGTKRMNIVRLKRQIEQHQRPYNRPR